MRKRPVPELRTGRHRAGATHPIVPFSREGRRPFGRKAAFAHRVAAGCCGLLVLCGSVGCWGVSEREVVVYAALDAEFSQPLLEDFTRDTTVKVLANYDVESTKTVGLVTRILRERRRPRCDVFWNNEILHTLRLQQQGLLEPHLFPAGQSLPPNYRASDGSWYGFAARARVLLVNTRLVSEPERPASILDLQDPKWNGRAGMAKPLFGTTATHASVLFATWGDARAREYFTNLKRNVAVLSGNKQVAMAVGRGDLAFGITDTDDAIVELEQGRPVAIVYPDQHDDGLGTLFIPNTLCIIKGGPHPMEARHLVEYLLTATVETKLAQGHSAQFPVLPGVSVGSRAAPPHPVRWMDADFQQAAAHWDAATGVLRELFATAE
ncbi:MAG: extracellular solute-binding protein [Planctomycetes bacterium]|nr:extracellular solute-binding protein [Planctomycetota bacterium]